MILAGTNLHILAVRCQNEDAFGQLMEAEVVDRLRVSCVRLLSLVAVPDERVVSKVLFSPVVLESEVREHNGMGFGPMAVPPSLQD
ncbi:MAG: hypothetical protein HY896_12795 [Deltaproteobacteria bacterium]|nr:hypothetical protein [Deltaproteobacteria bacterium]